MTTLLAATNLHKRYGNYAEPVHALRGVSLEVNEGECVAVIGESGSGKSSLIKALLALETPDEGEVLLNGQALFRLRPRELRAARRQMQVVFQNPSAALNPRLPIWRSIMEPLDNFKDVTPGFLKEVRHSRKETAYRLLQTVGLDASHLQRYPHELSGGQQQRAAIARGISLGPKLLICDEPTSSLDVSVQAQMLKLLARLKEELGMACLFITHDLAAASMLCDRFMVMKDGEAVDRFNSGELLGGGRHPYTRRLAQAAL